MPILKLTIAELRRDGGTQIRTRRDETTVAEYADALRANVKLPPAIVFRDEEGDDWLADGFHRIDAAEAAGRRVYPCDVRRGTRRDAVLFACGANDDHGLRRTNADKRRAVETLLNDEEWSKGSVSWLAEAARVSRTLVEAVMADLQKSKSPERHGRDGRTINTKRIGEASTARAAARRIDTSEAQAAPDDEVPAFTVEDEHRTEGGAVAEANGGPDAVREEPPATPAAERAVDPRHARDAVSYAGQYDDRGRPVPAHLVATFETGRQGIARIEGDLKGACERWQQLQAEYRRSVAAKRPLLSPDDYAGLEAAMDEVQRYLGIVSGFAPGALCDACNAAGCVDCGGLGWHSVAVGRRPRTLKKVTMDRGAIGRLAGEGGGDDDLTQQQLRVLAGISELTNAFSWPPTLAELAGYLDYKSKGAVKLHLDELVRQKLVERDGSPRGLAFTDAGRERLGRFYAAEQREGDERRQQAAASPAR